jgi:threonine/homoserine/homoserine lactone efflux protein
VLGLWALAVMTPGPDTLAVVSTSLARSRRAGMAVALGCAVATMLWASASLIGLALVFERAQWLYHLVRLAGAAYLVVLGAALLCAAWTATPPDSGAPTARTADGWRAFRLGVLTDLANPKAAVFFTSLFAVALPHAAGSAVKTGVVLAVGAIAAAWYVLIAATVCIAPVTRLYRRGRRVVEATTGALFLGLGAKLAVDR